MAGADWSVFINPRLGLQSLVMVVRAVSSGNKTTHEVQFYFDFYTAMLNLLVLSYPQHWGIENEAH